jgi:hypothetical protein
VSAAYTGEVLDAEPVPEQPRPYDAGTPIAGRHPATMPELPPVVVEGPIVMSAPADAIQLPRQRRSEDQRYTAAPAYGDPRRGNEPARPASAEPRNDALSALRRRVPGSQLPAETGPALASTPPSTDDALAAREAFEAFEAGVTRAQWEVIEADMASPPAAGHAPLARRVPGASMPVSEPMNKTPPASPTRPLDPDAARDLIEQFEHGVARALNETRPQHEGQPR